MSQIAIYLNDEVQKLLDRTAKKEGKSRSAWIKEAILDKVHKDLPKSWFQVWGSWDDARSTEEIMKDIRTDTEPQERKPLK
jgi:hypothetical protein